MSPAWGMSSKSSEVLPLTRPPGTRGQKRKPNYFIRVVSEKPFGEKMSVRGWPEGSEAQRSSVDPTRRPGPAAAACSAFGALTITASAASRRVGVGGGQHPQQRGATSGAGRLASSTNPGDGAGPFETGVHRCGLFTVLFAHRKKLPQAETRPSTVGPRSTIPLGREEHVSLTTSPFLANGDERLHSSQIPRAMRPPG